MAAAIKLGWNVLDHHCKFTLIYLLKQKHIQLDLLH